MESGYLGNANRFLDEVVGGFQLAGDGNIVSQDFQPVSTNWGATSPLVTYKHKAKITDCRSGTCYPAYEWFNGYIAPTAIAGNSCPQGSATKVVSGLPSNWSPYLTPINNLCTNASGAAYAQYGTNNVQITAPTLTGSPVTIGYAPGPYGTGSSGANPYSHTVLNGPINWTVDLSVFKVFPITEKTNLRVNVDAFNALNIQGYTNPNTTDGVEQIVPGAGVASSYNTPRQIQLTMRLTF